MITIILLRKGEPPTLENPTKKITSDRYLIHTDVVCFGSLVRTKQKCKLLDC